MVTMAGKKEWLPLLVILFITYVIAVYTIINKPILPEVTILEKTFPMFALSLQAFLLLVACALVMHGTWVSGNKKNEAHIFWAVGFAFFSVLFLGLMLQAMGYSFANMNNPSIFFLWRQVMVWWIALIYCGIAKVVFKNKLFHYVPTALIMLMGYGILAYGLIFGPKDIEWTMYGFLSLVVVPVCFLVSFLFYIYWKKTRVQAPGFLSLGFLGMAVAYLAWAPWHQTMFYFIWFSVFVLSLVPTLIGMIMIKRRTYEPIIKKKLGSK